MPNIEFLISDSQLAFLNQQNETALELAKQAIALDGKSADAYKCAANALMSLERYEDAIKNYRLALKYDPANGNRYFDLGFALATNEKLADVYICLLRRKLEAGGHPRLIFTVRGVGYRLQVEE